MYSHQIDSPKNLAQYSGNTSSKIFSCIRTSANTGPACIRAKINSPIIFPALPFVRQYAPHLYRRTSLASKLRRKGNPAVRLPFVLQYASHLYGSAPPICTAVLLKKYWGLGSPERF